MPIFKIKNQLYVRNDFEGSHSLKAVVPVRCPELSYDNLAIQEGATASASWPILTGDTVSATEKVKLADYMLKYCKRDTETMVCILEKLGAEIKANACLLLFLAQSIFKFFRTMEKKISLAEKMAGKPGPKGKDK